MERHIEIRNRKPFC